MNLVIGSKALATGTVNAITATFSPAPTLADQTLLWLKCIGANTGPVTFSPNGLTVRPVTKNSGDALEAGDIAGAGFIAIFWYDLANTRWVLLNPKVSAPNLNLSQVLTNGASTGNQTIESPDGNSFASIVDDEATIAHNGGLITVTDLALIAAYYYALRPSTGVHNFAGTSIQFNGDELATQNYVASAVAGLLDYRGVFDASGGAYPSSGGSGTAGAILKSDFWIISVAGTLPTGQVVEAGDLVISKIDTPGNTQANWNIIQYNIGYTPENAANKDTDGTLAANSDTKYASQKATKTYADTKGFTIQGAATVVNPADGTTHSFADANVATSTTYITTVRLYVPKDCTLKRVFVFVRCTPGSGETGAFSVMQDGTTPAVVTSSMDWSNTVASFSKTDFNVAFTAGQWINFKVEYPSFVTNPTGVTYTVSCYFE